MVFYNLITSFPDDVTTCTCNLQMQVNWSVLKRMYNDFNWLPRMPLVGVSYN